MPYSFTHHPTLPTTMLACANRDKLDRAYIRKLSKKAYGCMAACHDQSAYTSQDIQQCVGQCSVGLQEVNQLIGNEMNYFQNRLQVRT